METITKTREVNYPFIDLDMKYIDAGRLVAEIKRLKQENAISDDKEYAQYELDVACGYDMALEKVLLILNSLQQEQPEINFEEEWDRFEDWAESYNQSDYPTCYEPKQIARHFFELSIINARKEK